ncbi:hypothetical protein DFH07DRAFT_1060222, partial [Mycena maculata]
MGGEIQPKAEFKSESAITNVDTVSYTGAFFPTSRNLVVSGGHFTSVTNNNTTASIVPSDFRRIPLGDIYLRNEIRLDAESGVVDRHNVRGSVRRVYLAKINGKSADMTVALYQGDSAE